MAKASTYLLVHGAWHGAWCWAEVVASLQALGHQVIAPDLPTVKPTLASYVEAIKALVLAQPEPVILVGHSMAGMIISEVAEAIPEHIQSLIYVCAYVPQHGESLMKLASAASTHHLSQFVHIDPTASTITLSPLAGAIDLMYANANENQKAQAVSCCQPQALQPFLDTVSLSHRFASVRKRAIVGEHDQVIAVSDQRAMAIRATTDVITLPADHAPFYSCVSRLVQAIVNNDK